MAAPATPELVPKVPCNICQKYYLQKCSNSTSVMKYLNIQWLTFYIPANKGSKVNFLIGRRAGNILKEI